MTSPFVLQAVLIPGGGSMTVTAQRTDCPSVVIAPNVGVDHNGAAVLTGSLALVHTETGQRIVESSWPDPLYDLASRLSSLDWSVIPPVQAAEVVRQWRLDTHAGVAAHLRTYSGMSDTARSVVAQPLDQWSTGSGAHRPAGDDLRFGVIYLLCALVTADPDGADRVARDLSALWRARDCAAMQVAVRQFSADLAAGRIPVVDGVPRWEDTASFPQQRGLHS